MTDSNLTPLLLGLAFVAVTAARSVLLRQTVGVNAYVIDHGDPTHRFIGMVFLGVFVGLVAYFSAVAFSPQVEDQMGKLDWAANETTRWVSIAVMSLAIVWTGYAQFSMEDSWRIGVPKGDAPPLRTHGPFAISRNPIFLGMLAFVFGMALWSPSAVTVALLAATYIPLEVQTRAKRLI